MESRICVLEEDAFILNKPRFSLILLSALAIFLSVLPVLLQLLKVRLKAGDQDLPKETLEWEERRWSLSPTTKAMLLY